MNSVCFLNLDQQFPKTFSFVYPEQYMKEMSFNLGAGFGFFLLTAASQRELEKMKELRTQMEVILQDIKEEFQRKFTISRSFDSSDTPASSTTDEHEAPKFDLHHSFPYNTPSYFLPDSDITMMSDESLKCHELGQQEFSGSMDQLATELEAELELLELHLDQEHSKKHSQRVEVYAIIIKDPFFFFLVSLFIYFATCYTLEALVVKAQWHNNTMTVKK